ncbi:hypothetical protein BJY16_004801 [Actinoplanes octamycinicus]|uniref:Uncharacterized protein n=1 Tax=Actinoplanes octamycinicus TaxID=135948 RepID=A0A7W7GZZ1_9ACTN|nr:protealysin inhibitor emfourin [Actinoplanes octamycinicus]MBB4741342.1 hypothetical protein [Actinoplanes octamycinicus]GIE62858.1 hypothetical protein Aoc01nite_82600 [Actinoplanes octamycinicus]
MRVTLTTRGGLAAAITPQLPPTVVDTTDLKPDAAAELRALIAAAASAAPVAPNPRVRDAMTYTVLVEDDGDTTTLTASDAAMTAPFSALLSWLEDQ